MADLPHLLLFDIDGTLLDSGGAGLDALVAATAELYPEQVASAGRPEFDLAGSTDSGIAMQIFATLGIDDSPAERSRFYGCYLGHLKRNLGRPGCSGTLLAGVRELLQSVATLPGERPVLVGLLTGNIAAGARVKTEYYGLGGYFGFGAYGDDHHARARLGPVAVRRAGSLVGCDLRGAPTTVVGDTPKDIRCARAMGARAVAVATGRPSGEELAQHQPDALLPDFTDMTRARRALCLD